MSTKIVIASTLKPISDPRAYEKIGISLAATEKYEVVILGSANNSLPTTNSILFLPHNKPGNALARLFLPFKICLKILQQKPQVLIITTHELLLSAIVLKAITGLKLIYDIQENYNFNLRYQKIYPWGIRQLMACYIRLKELISKPFIDEYFLAEKCYVDEIKFLSKGHFTILENKHKPVEPEVTKGPQQVKTEFLLSGTISQLYGAYEAVNFIKQFPEDEYCLRIIGHCPEKKLRRYLNEVANSYSNLIVNISSQPIPHSEILAIVGSKTIGLLPYQDNKSTRNKLPTKLYEYIGLGIPVLISPNSNWKNLIETYKAGIIFDFTQQFPIGLFSRLKTLIISNEQLDLKDIMWYNEELKLLSSINRVLSDYS